ncbi:NADPH:quinone reductase [Ophidiomyces ophidiicola]|nr:NADPH:quinone reductase [Ophidiomyces ophidiicola]
MTELAENGVEAAGTSLRRAFVAAAAAVLGYAEAMAALRHLSFRAGSIARVQKPVSALTQAAPHPLLLPSAHVRTMATATIPTTQKGIQISRIGGPEVLEYHTSLPVPQPGPGEVLIKNNLSGVNYIDTYFRTGLYPAPKPEILGREGAGTIVAIGPGSKQQNFKVGDRVAWLNTGGYAEYSIAPAERHVARIPDGVSDEQALTVLLSGITTLSLVREAYPVQKGDWILLHAAAGGAGYLMTQMLKMAGAKVIGTAGGLEKVELVKSLGADAVIDYKSAEGQNWLEKVMELTGGEGVAAVFDSVGKDTWENSIKAVKRKGTMVFFGNASGPVPSLNIQYDGTPYFDFEAIADNHTRLLSAKNIKLMRTSLFAYIATQEEFDSYTKELFDMVESGKLKTKLHKIYPLEQAAQAHIDLEGRKTTGKLLLRP